MDWPQWKYRTQAFQLSFAKPKPDEVGSIWKGGARERENGIFCCAGIKNARAKRTLLRRGRSGEIRTPGLMDPNHARYQLRYTPKYSSVFLGQIKIATLPLARYALLLASPARKKF